MYLLIVPTAPSLLAPSNSRNVYFPANGFVLKKYLERVLKAGVFCGILYKSKKGMFCGKVHIFVKFFLYSSLDFS